MGRIAKDLKEQWNPNKTPVVPIKTAFSEKQLAMYNATSRYKVLAKGRRWGATISAAQYVIREMVNRGPTIGVLWVDVIYSNIDRYFDRYFRPILHQIPKDYWNWNQQKKILKIYRDETSYSFLDMRSADRPENLEGFSYNLIIFNEAGIIFKDNRQLWQLSVAPMAIDHSAQVLFLGTPKGKYDSDGTETLFYELYKKGLPPPGGRGHPGAPLWRSYHYSTYDNPMMTREQIQEIENEVPPVLRQQEIYAEFLDISAESVFKEVWFPIVPALPEAGIIRKIFSLDTAFKTKEESDFSAGVLIYQTQESYYVVDVFNEKLEFPELLRKVQEMYDQYRPDTVLIEDRASGQSLIQTLVSQTTIPVHPFSPDKDKYTRACAITPICEYQRVKFLEGPWNQMLRLQLVNFPCGHDDLTDALSQALTYLKDCRGQKPKILSSPVKQESLQGYNAGTLKDTLSFYSGQTHSRFQGY